MSTVRLKKIFSREEEMKVISLFISELDIIVVISDDKQVLFDNNTENIPLPYGCSIDFKDEKVGTLLSSKDPAGMLGFLRYIMNNEFEKKELASETLDIYREISLLYDLSKKISMCMDISQISDLAILEAIKHIRATVAVVAIKNEEDGTLRIVSEYCKNKADSLIARMAECRESPGSMVCQFFDDSAFYKNSIHEDLDTKDINMIPSINMESSIIKSVIETGVADIFNNIKNDLRYIQGSSFIYSLICAPIIKNDVVFGVFVIGNENKITYTSQNLKLFTAITFELSVAIENIKLYNVLEETFFQTINALADTIDKRDPYTGGHVQRVMNYSILTGEKMGLSKSELSRLKLSALMHDIGKIGISDNILGKQSELTKEEYAIMRKHAEYGSDILKNIVHLRDIIPGVRSHHERYDGKGYPDKLKGDEIDVFARIICVADAFDAMTTSRPYRKALSSEIAIREIIRNAGTQFDPEVVKVFVEVYNEKLVK